MNPTFSKKDPVLKALQHGKNTIYEISFQALSKQHLNITMVSNRVEQTSDYAFNQQI